MERSLVLNALLIIVTVLALDWRESRWVRRTRRYQTEGDGGGSTMLHQAGKAVVALALGLAFSGLVPAAYTVDKGRLEADRLACIENGGWFHPDSGLCDLDWQDDVTPSPAAPAATPATSQE